MAQSYFSLKQTDLSFDNFNKNLDSRAYGFYGIFKTAI